ncbi:GTP cyclohydrolase 1 type 2 homolog [Ylistrum balloti]|uniref:GTP cyclohydrolase 1 type 2 homolog n=1 Tax=Ylistrum balloti TaxID=509963 RepID=UPI002905D310|nr:GTP cyclohydrolase 1 type 2 homolog [Ylistrum balloti]
MDMSIPDLAINGVQVENNGKALGFNHDETFGDYKGTPIIFSGTTQESISLKELVDQLTKKIGEPLHVTSISQRRIKKIGVCTGGGLFGIEEAKKRNCDAYITGDASHTTYHLAMELDIHLISGGHYNTEVLGIKALGEKISKELSIPTTFIDLPTGL